MDEAKPNELLVCYQSPCSLDVLDVRNTRFSTITGKKSPLLVQSTPLHLPENAIPLSLQPFFSSVCISPCIHRRRMLSPLSRMVRSPWWTVTPVLCVSTRMNSAMQTCISGIVSFLAPFAPRFWANLCGFRRSWEGHRAFLSSISSLWRSKETRQRHT